MAENPLSAKGIANLLRKRLQEGDFDPRFDKRKLEQDRLRSLDVDMIERNDVMPRTPIALSELEGEDFVTSMSDRTGSGALVLGAKGVPFNSAVNLPGGQGFMFENPGQVWASAQTPSQAILDSARGIPKSGRDPLLIPWRMAPSGGDFSTTTGELMFAHASAAMNKTQKKALDAAIRKFVTVGSVKDGKRKGDGLKIKGWKGVDDPASIEVWRNTPDTVRKEIMNMMDVQFRGKGGLSIGEARLINADPLQLTARDAGIQNVGRIDVSGDLIPSGHPSYPYGVQGTGIATLPRATEATIFDLLPTARFGKAQKLVGDPAAPTKREMRALQMKPYVGKITDKILKRMQDRGVDINSFAGLTGTALTASLVTAGLLTSQEAEALPGIGDMLDPKTFGLTTKMRESVQRSKQKVQSGSQWEGFLKNKGVPKGEFEVFGLSDILKRESVTQDELIDAIDQNQLELRKTVLSDKPSVNIDFKSEPVDFDIVYPQRVIDEKVKAEIEYFKDEAKNTLTPQNTSDGVVVYDDFIKEDFWSDYKNPEESLGMSEEDFDLWLYNDEGDLSGEAELALNNFIENKVRKDIGQDSLNFSRLTLQKDGMPTDYSIIKATDEDDYVNWYADPNMDADLQKRWQQNYSMSDMGLRPTTYSDNEAQVQLQDMYEGDNPSARSESPMWEDYTLDGGTNYRELLLQVDPEGPSMFGKAHSGLPNEVGHIRVKDRIGPNGEKVLYVEEVQSDWAQKGRKKGFLDSEKVEPVLAANNEMMQQLYSGGGPFERFMMSVTPEPIPENTSVRQFVDRLKKQAVFNQEGLPISRYQVQNLPVQRQLDAYKDISDNSRTFRADREGNIQTNAVAIVSEYIFKNKPELVEKISDYVRAAEVQRLQTDPSSIPLLPTRITPINKRPDAPSSEEETIQRAIVERYVRNRLILENPEVLQKRRNYSHTEAISYEKTKPLSDFLDQDLIDQALQDAVVRADSRINEQFAELGVNKADVDEIINIVDSYEESIGENMSYLDGIQPNVFVTKSKAWNDLLTKNILKEASDGDYDLVAFAPSSVHINRWNEEGLEQQYDVLLPSAFKKITGQTPSPSIRYDKRPQGGMPKDTSEWAEDTVITDDGWRFRSTTVPGRQRYVNSEFQEWIPDDPKNPEGSGSINYEVEGWISPVIDLRETMKGQKDMSVKDFVKKKSLPLFSTAIATSAGISALSPELMASEVSMKADVASGEAALDIISGLIAPVAGGIAGLMQYKEQLPQRVYEVLNNNPEAVAALASNVKQAREDVASGLNYEPRSALARQASDEFKKGIVSMLEPVIDVAAPVVDYALDPENVYDERGLNLLPAAVQGGKFIYDQILGEPEREAVISAMETI
jgi:hypothetical protein